MGEGLEAITIGEVLAEFYGKEMDKPLYEDGDFNGPFPAGAPAIFADTIAKVGGSAGFIGVVGDDDFGKVAIDKFLEDGVDVSYLRKSEEYTTGTSFVTYFSDGSREFLFHLERSAAGQLSSQDISSDYISKADFLHVTGSTVSMNETCRETVYEAVEVAKENGLKVTYDPNLRPELLKQDSPREVSEPILENCDFLLPNESELEMLSRKGDNLVENAREFLEYPIDTVVVKRGKEGAIVVEQDNDFDVSPYSIEEIDPTGAGDSFDAGFVHGLIEGKDLKEATRFANATGALAVTSRGGMAGIKGKEEILRLMES